ncbi:hypothetical protein ASZ90_010277 [hydrocarbon metagenome]|uniref:Uncharacterized protein n=1 Tax=hydrocarbon metagenome TaxID=938273 RepID=A0A0W8FGG4_9ZZZZ|nr:hypothetical protein [Methanomicrobiaceae archaeon]
MSCNLPPEALFVLDVLYKGRHFRPDAGYHSEKLSKIYTKKFPERTFLALDDTVRLLMNEGYISQIPKKKVKYYISDRKKTIFALKSHNFNVVDGRFHRL